MTAMIILVHVHVRVSHVSFYDYFLQVRPTLMNMCMLQSYIKQKQKNNDLILISNTQHKTKPRLIITQSKTFRTKAKIVHFLQEPTDCGCLLQMVLTTKHNFSRIAKSSANRVFNFTIILV